MGSFKYSLDRLNKNDEEWFTFADEQHALDLLWDPRTRPYYSHMFDVITDVASDAETERLFNEDRRAFVLAVFKVHGRQALGKLNEWRTEWWKLKRDAEGTRKA